MCYVAVDVAVPSSKGSSTHVIEVGKNLQEMGTRLVVLSRRTGPWQPKTDYCEGLELRRVYRGIFGPIPLQRKSKEAKNGGEGTGFTSRLYRLYLSTIVALYCGFVAAGLVRKYKLNAIIERETSYGAGAIASLLTGRPLILEVNGPRLSRISTDRAVRITAYSYSMVGPEVRSKTRIVDAGVNPELFKPDQEARSRTRARYNVGDSPVVGYVGSFQRWHGTADLVRASQVVLTAYPQTRFLMVGPGFEETRNLAERLGVVSSYVFTGPVPYSHVPRYVNASDILISPTNPSKSVWTLRHGAPEQFKIFEYMACRKPVVATAVGPMRRIVKDGITGIVVPPADQEALSEAICRLIRDQKMADRLAEQAYRTVVEEYTWAKHAKTVYQTILSALGDAPPGTWSR